MKCKLLLVFFMFLGLQSSVFASDASEQLTTSELESKVSKLQSKVWELETAQNKAKSDISKIQETLRHSGLAIVLFAFFCAWWAKTSGRSALLWFILGMLFHVLTAIALLIKTERST
ncbi:MULTISPECIES: hypothetical protein [unclassified Pseudoalteromonas]|uniref:hypothetical protein n=1 Tax=unclassified Pseudoalteromonas TaxID=194690 RepID=UPI000CF60FFB|nr:MULTISPECIES: hypothetical protein [unclassified Pseudoalteromonas]